MNKIIALYQNRYDEINTLRNCAIVYNTDNDLYSVWVGYDRLSGERIVETDNFKTYDDAYSDLLTHFPNAQFVFKRDIENEIPHFVSDLYSTIAEKEFKEIVEKHEVWLKGIKTIDNPQVADLHFRCMEDWELRNINLSHGKMQHILMNGSNIRDCRFYRADLSHSSMQGSTLVNVLMQDAYLPQSDLRGIYCKYVDFEDADMAFCNLQNADLRGANLSNACLRGADLRGTDLSGANLSKADLSLANLNGANLSNAVINDVDLSCATLIETNLHCASIQRTTLSRSCLSGANFESADIFESSLGGTYGQDINFKKSYMCSVDLTNTEFIRPDFQESNLIAAIMKEATVANGNFQNSDLSHADLSFSDFSHTCLQGAKLYGANVEYTNFYHADLSGADVDNAMFYKCSMEGAITRGTYLFPKAIANYIMNEGTSETTTGNWCISFEEINRQFDVNLPADEALLAEILKYFDDNIVSDVEITDSEFDMTFYTDYCPNVEEETEMEV